MFDTVLGDFPLETYTIIGEIDSVQLLDGRYYKCLKNNDGTIRIIQGIGSLNGFFFMNRLKPMYVHCEYHESVCFHRGSQFIYQNSDYKVCHSIPITTNSISSVFSNSSIKIYPNPSTNQLRITNYELRNSTAEYSIYSIMGQIIMSGKLQNETTIINVESLAKGMYFLQIQSSEGVFNKKIVKQE